MEKDGLFYSIPYYEIIVLEKQIKNERKKATKGLARAISTPLIYGTGVWGIVSVVTISTKDYNFGNFLIGFGVSVGIVGACTAASYLADKFLGKNGLRTCSDSLRTIQDYKERISKLEKIQYF